MLPFARNDYCRYVSYEELFGSDGKQVVMKRFRARAKGRAAGIKKPYSNLTVILAEKKKEVKDGTKS